MTEPIPYACKALYLTKEETRNGRNLGLRFVLENKDRWEDIADTTYELQTYDKGTSQIVHNNKLYMVHRDFIFVDSAERVFLCKCYEADVDTYVEKTEIEEEVFKPNPIEVAGQYDYLTEKKTDESTENEEPDESESEGENSVEGQSENN